MIYHVLPGDSTVPEFQKAGLDGEMIVCREAFVAGPISADGEDLWNERSVFMLTAYGEDEIGYHELVAREMERVHDVETGDEINLWFEYELFCSVNLWYFLTQLSGSRARVYRVHPAILDPEDRWKGFGTMTCGDLKACFERRIALTGDDIALGRKLWRAFGERDAGLLRSLGETDAPAFPYLAEVCDAAADIDAVPYEILAEIKFEGKTEFVDIFAEFAKRAGVYGFGDLQVEGLLEKLDQ